MKLSYRFAVVLVGLGLAVPVSAHDVSVTKLVNGHLKPVK